MHGVLIGGGYIFVALFANATAPLLRWILDQTLMGFLYVIDVDPFMAIDATDLAVVRFDEFLVDPVSVPAPHLRGGDASTGNGGPTSCLGGPILVHPIQIGMAIYACTAGGLLLGGKSSSQPEGTCQPQ